MFIGRHFFQLSPSNGATELLHGEDLSGLISMTFSKGRIERQKAACQAMNVAVAESVGKWYAAAP